MAASNTFLGVSVASLKELAHPRGSLLVIVLRDDRHWAELVSRTAELDHAISLYGDGVRSIESRQLDSEAPTFWFDEMIII